MNRWSNEDLAEVLNRNPQIRLSRPINDRQRVDARSSTIPRPEPFSAEIAPKATPHAPKQDYKAMLVQQCGMVGLKLQPEFKFHPTRKFRADWRVIGSDVLIEYEGGIFSSGKRGHSSIAGIRRDIEKSNLAQILGYKVIRVAPDHVVSGQALKWIEDAINDRR